MFPLARLIIVEMYVFILCGCLDIDGRASFL